MKILLVDDSKSARYALRLQLQRHGIEVETADSAESAFEILKTQLPDAILMDHMMPGLNGFEAFEVIREDPRTTHIPVVMCTSHEEAEFVATAKKKGVFGILPKSAAPELLPDILDKLRDKLAGEPAPQSAAPRVEPRVERIASAAAPGLSEEAIARLVDTRVESRLSTLLTPLLEDLRRELTETLSSQSRQYAENRMAEDQAARRTAPPTPTMADFQAITTQLATETLPDLVKRGIEGERGRLMESIEKQLHESRPKGEVPDAGDDSVTLKAVAMARRESQETIDAALSTSQQALQAMEQSLRSAMARVYLLALGSALVGIGAAAFVFFQLQP